MYYKYRNESTNITVFGSDGFMRAYGDAMAWEDEKNELIGKRLDAGGSKVNTNDAEGTVAFSTNCPITDRVVMNIQMPHSKVPLSLISPHLHWFQASTKMPNWLIQYRWQYGGIAPTTTWTSLPYTSNAFANGVCNQITEFSDITPSTDEHISDICQIRLTRDSANTSLEFATTDPYGATANAVSFDVHIKKDTIGSNSEYGKYA